MARVHSKEKRPQKKTGEVKVARTLSESKQKSLAAIKTAGDLSKLLNETNIAQVDVEEFLSEITQEEVEELEDTVLWEEPDNDGLREENDDLEDDYIDYDELRANDPFEVEDNENKGGPVYIVAVRFVEDNPVVEFLQVPQYSTNDVLVRNTIIIERFRLFREMASFIVEIQKAYFKTKKNKVLANLNQQDLVISLEKNKFRMKKEHVSRMLDVLFFKIDGLGTIPAKYFFKRYGTKSKLSQEEKLLFATEFLSTCESGLTQLAKAKGLVEFIRHKGIDIVLSNSENEHNKYKQFKTIIQRIEGADS